MTASSSAMSHMCCFMLPMLQANKVSCVGVISHAHGGGLVASLSSSDLLGVQPEHFGVLAMPVLDFLTAKASAGWGAQQHNQQQGLLKLICVCYTLNPVYVHAGC
eukprot:GHRR01016482.1.p2 GENE.GHRR01016482.1~~GHRR01016482.1.p2  ORF type:complete len:105 (-),score=36.35 GHRR01016482.1:30-344(-)